MPVAVAERNPEWTAFKEEYKDKLAVSKGKPNKMRRKVHVKVQGKLLMLIRSSHNLPIMVVLTQKAKV